MIVTDIAPHFSLTWAPQPDITVYELALCLPVVAMAGAYDVGSVKRWYEALPVGAQRHFEVTGQPSAAPTETQAAKSVWDSLKSVASA